MKTQYITDDNGNKTAIILPIKEYQKIMEDLEEFACVKAFDEAHKYRHEFAPAEDVFKAIERKRSGK